MYKEIFNRLPQNYSKQGQANNEKFHKIIFDEAEELRYVFEEIRDSKDIDRAYGKSLDYIGRNVQELRSSDDDNVYRQFIKTKIIANLSKGDVETLNTVADFLLGDKFLGFKESWDIEGYGDVAGLVGEFKLSLNSIPFILDRVKSGGVKLYWEATAVDNLIKVLSHTWQGSFKYPLCNEIDTGTWWYQQNHGRVKNSDVKLTPTVDDKLFNYPETALVASSKELFAGHEFAEQLTLEQIIKLETIIKDVDFNYIKVNEILGGQHPDIMNKVKGIRSKLGLNNNTDMGSVGYPVSGDALTKKE